MRPLAGALLAVAALTVCGCARQADRAEANLQVEQRIAASRAGLTPARAREIVSQVTGVDAETVTVIHRSVNEGVAAILAIVPPAPGMRHEEARRPTIPAAITEQTIEIVDLRWDMQADLPTLILWGERLQFASREPTTREEAEAVARELLERWVPEEAGEIAPPPAQKLEAPVYVVSRLGTLDGHLTGDRAVVQVSSVTGLPISFSQRIARQRPSPDEIAVTRDEAIEVVREHLRGEGFPAAATVNLVAQLTLSAERHPEGGPAWLVALIRGDGQQMRVLMVDAMSGEMLTAREDGDG